MLFTHISCLLAASSLVAAAPFEKRWVGLGSHWWTSNAPSSSYLDFGKRVPGPSSNGPSCDLSQAQMPQAPKPLPSPADNLHLFHVAIGRGTQNYTCDLSNATAIPVAVGALATLFNSSCMAADQPTLMQTLPSIAVDLPVPVVAVTAPVSQDVSGHHYFTDATTPFFNLDTSEHSYGTGAFKKLAASPAPADAPSGQLGTGNGAVPWLLLALKNDSGDHTFQQVYRVNTAGGQPPATCAGSDAAFEVQYAAEYWFYG